MFGVQQIFEAAPALQTVLRAVGGVYLLYLAWGLFRSLRRGGNTSDVASGSRAARDREPPPAGIATKTWRPTIGAAC